MIKQCTTLSGFKASGTNYCWRRGYVEGPCIADMLVNVQLRLETNASFFTLIALPKTAFIVSPSCMFQPTNFPATNLPTSCIQLYVIFITACEGRHSVTFRRFRSNPCETMPYSLVHAAGGKNREGAVLRRLLWSNCSNVRTAFLAVLGHRYLPPAGCKPFTEICSAIGCVNRRRLHPNIHVHLKANHAQLLRTARDGYWGILIQLVLRWVKS